MIFRLIYEKALLPEERREIKGEKAARSKPGTLYDNTPLLKWAKFLERAVSDNNYDMPFISVESLFSYTEKEISALNLESPKKPLFPEFLHPFVTQAFKDILTRLEKYSSLLSLVSFLSDHKVKSQLGRYLVSRLSYAASRTIPYEIRQPAAQEALDRAGLKKSSPESRYKYFLSNILGSKEGILSFYEKYPVLARIHSLYTIDFIDFITQVIINLSRDIKTIERVFFNKKSAERLISFQPGLSDSHNRGKTVCCLEFSSGLKIIYKPRSLKIDQAWNVLVEWINQNDSVLPLYKSNIIDKGNYGWAEFIENRACLNLKQLAAYYRRQGMHTALFYLLCGEDFHQDNFIAAGEYPVPVDLEGLMAPGLHVIPDELSKIEPHFYAPAFTILSSAMVPCWRAGDDALPFFEFSGINGTGDRKWPLKLPFWENLGTDRIKLSRNFRACPGYACRPIISGQRPSVEMFMRDLELGFKQACELFIDNREFLLSKESPLESFRDIAVRCIIRDTNDYGNILFWSYAPDHLVSGDAYSISLEAVFSKEVKFGLSDRPCKSEKLSLTHGDIPVFTGFTDSCSLFIDGKLYTEQTGPADTFSQVIHRIGRLDLKVIQWQIKLINASFQMSFEKEKNKDARTKIKRDFYTKENPDLPISGRLIKEACLIGDALERQAVIFEGAASWIKLVRPFDNSTSVNCAYSDPFLYNGTAGIALFLVNLYYASKNKKYFDLAKAALTYSVKVIGKLKEASGFVIPLSAFTGLFGIIYALTETGRLVDDSAFFDTALNLACSIEQSDFLEYPDSDIMGGSAGIILVLLHLYNFRPDNKILAMSKALLNSIIKCSEGKLGEKGWNINGFQRPLTGMAHGAAGIAMAVSRFNSIIKSDYKLVHFSAADLESAIKNSITFENSYFCDKEKDWPDLQHLKDREKFFMEGWCSGAPGIGLARLFTETQSSETNKIIQADIIRALKTCTKNMSSTKKHHLCCGESGRIMFLACAGIKADMPEYYEIALKAAINMINFYKIKGFWRFQKVNERMIVHGLMGGVSGIGLTFLKLADQENISNILTLS